VIARSKKNLSGKVFSCIQEIIYIGMTGCKKGLCGRLKQFEKTLDGSVTSHGGAHRVRKKYSKRKIPVSQFYVAVMPIGRPAVPSAKRSRKKIDRIYGQELRCLAEYIYQHEKIPEFNDWERSPKGE
jgi:hypothetical protein